MEATSETQGRASDVSELKSVGSSSVDLSVCSATDEGGATSGDEPSRHEDDEEQEDAVMALLSLQRMPSSDHLPLKVEPPPSVNEPPPPITGSKRRAVSPCAGEFASQRYSPVPKGDGEARFFCK